MSTPLLTTKLFIPPTRPELVPRLRLLEQLSDGLRRKLTLISAPAGFGKTTLLSTWVQNLEPHINVAWLSLDEGDNDLNRFLTYFVAALQSVENNIGQGVLVSLQSPGSVNVEILLTTLLNDIAEFPDDLVLILDDYHVIESQPIDNAIIYLLEHQPPQLHLVIASRIDPSWTLSRLRALGHMSEVRAENLRFTPDEATTFLNQVMGFDLSANDVAALDARTEGWIAGLQLAAISMKGLKKRNEIINFITRFTGSDHYIQDYLADEVLQQRPKGTRNFLLQTSILKRLSGSLCDAVTEKDNSQAILESLDAANLFILPLDNERCWYRYHHLFADLLRQRLRQTYQEQMPTLHSRASEWYEQNALPADAIQHAFAANDLERVASLAELSWPNWSGNFQSITWLGWVRELPDKLVSARPVLSLSYAWAFLNAGDLEAAEARLKDVERWLEPSTNISDQPEAPATEMVVVDEDQFRLLPVSLAFARAYHAQAIGDVVGTVKYAQQVLNLVPEGDHQWREDATMLMGLAYWASGNLEAAHRTFSDGLASASSLDAIVGTFVLADMKMTLGHLREATRICEFGLKLAKECDQPNPMGTEDVYSGISHIHREQGDLEAAAQALATSKKLGEQIELPDWEYRWCIAQARLKQTLGELDEALELLDEAERVYVQTPLPVIHPFAALKTRVWIRQGRLNEALSWVREQALSVDDELSYLREFEHITLARVLIARYQQDHKEDIFQDAIKLLTRLLQAAEEGGRTTSEIEVLILLALTHEIQGDISTALGYLEQALTLAEPGGYIRIFVDEGQPLARLLFAAADQKILPDYIRKLLAVFESEQLTSSSRPQQNLVEPLSEREIEVLRLIAQGLSNREISERLYLALDTVKGHNRKIFGKLGVRKRLEAVTRAQELGIL